MADRRGRWTAADVPDQSGRTAVVTGASGGLGLETAEVLAGHGAAVVLAGRDLGKTERAADRIRSAAAGASVLVVHLDLASLASVREAAGQIRAACPSLDLLINNAGVMAIPREVTEDGFERTLATNHLGHFALTGLLLGRMLGSPRLPGRDRQQQRPPDGRRRQALRGSPARAWLQAVARLLPVQAGEPPVHLRTAAAP